MSLLGWFSEWLDNLTPRQLATFHKWGLAVWVVIGVPLSLMWRDWLPWTMFMSLYAIQISHATGYPAARAEARLEKQEDTSSNMS